MHFITSKILSQNNPSFSKLLLSVVFSQWQERWLMHSGAWYVWQLLLPVDTRVQILLPLEGDLHQLLFRYLPSLKPQWNYVLNLSNLMFPVSWTNQPLVSPDTQLVDRHEENTLSDYISQSINPFYVYVCMCIIVHIIIYSIYHI